EKCTSRSKVGRNIRHGRSGGSFATEDRLDVVTIWIEHERGVIIRPSQAGRSVFGRTCLEGGRMKCVDLLPAFGREGVMLLYGVRVESIDPEDRKLETVANAVGPHVIGHLHHSAHSKRFQSRVVEDGGT